LTDPERTALGLPATEAGCVTQFENDAGCQNATADNICDGSEIFHPDKAQT